MTEDEAPALQPARIVGALIEHDVKYVLVGGIAGLLYGAQRPTADFDICPAWDKDNLTRLTAALKSLGALEKGMNMPPDVAAISNMEVTNWRTSVGDIDVLLGIPDRSKNEKAQYRQLVERALAVDVGPDTVLVAPLEAVIRSKQIANRPKDREALPELIAIAEQRQSSAGIETQSLRRDSPL